jgi:hypothetical protein
LIDRDQKSDDLIILGIKGESDFSVENEYCHIIGEL